MERKVILTCHPLEGKRGSVIRTLPATCELVVSLAEHGGPAYPMGSHVQVKPWEIVPMTEHRRLHENDRFGS